MIEKIIHFSDLHIKLFKEHENYRKILSLAFDQWKKIKPDRIVFTGDLVHSKNQMTPELVGMISWVLTECSKMAKTIIIPGNHDFLENNMERLDAISPIIDALDNDSISYYKERGVVEDENIRWAVYSLMDGNIPPEIEQNKNSLTIGLFHGPVIGLTTDVGYTFDSGFNSTIFEGCDFVFCGDIHKRQIFDFPGGKAFMIGSTISQNFGESVRNHGYGLFTVSEKKYETFNLENTKPFLKFKIKSIEDIETESEIHVNR